MRITVGWELDELLRATRKGADALYRMDDPKEIERGKKLKQALYTFETKLETDKAAEKKAAANSWATRSNQLRKQFKPVRKWFRHRKRDIQNGFASTRVGKWCGIKNKESYSYTPTPYTYTYKHAGD